MLLRPRKLLHTYRYETVAVLNGAVIMVLELVGARAIAPHLGNSIYVWTAVIGVILGAMSVGYWYGGRLADKAASDRILSTIILMGAGVLLVSLVLRENLLTVIGAWSVDVRVKALVASVVLFAPANVLMGIVSPYLAKLRVTNLSEAGRSIGRLYAAGTVGSIIGTFAAGYWLIAYFGNRTLGLGLVMVMVAASLLLSRRVVWPQLGLVVLTVAVMAWPSLGRVAVAKQKLVYDGDSAYQRIQVLDLAVGKRTMRVLLTDRHGNESGIMLDNPKEPAFDYIRSFVEVAKAYGSPKRVHVINEDGRVFLNGNHGQYDLVYVDAFSGGTPPFQLTTAEATGLVRNALAPDGVVVANVIGQIEGPGFFQAEYATYAKLFPMVAVTGSQRGTEGDAWQNLIMVTSKNPARLRATVKAWGVDTISPAAVGGGLSDDYAPVERLSDWRD